MRIFKGRESTGVRGIKLADDDRVIGMSMMRHVEVEVAEARAYLKQAAAVRRAAHGETQEIEVPAPDDDETTEIAALSSERYGRARRARADRAVGDGERLRQAQLRL